jgi:hypothetical protein
VSHAEPPQNAEAVPELAIAEQPQGYETDPFGAGPDALEDSEDLDDETDDGLSELSSPVLRPEPAPAGPVNPQRAAPLQLVMRESDDEEADQRRLASLFRLLQAQPGDDPIQLTIHTRDGETIGLALPSALLDEGMRESLKEALDAPSRATV